MADINYITRNDIEAHAYLETVVHKLERYLPRPAECNADEAQVDLRFRSGEWSLSSALDMLRARLFLGRH